MAIACPKCQHEHCFAKDSRTSGSTQRRRRVCNLCSYKFTTYEIASESYNAARGEPPEGHSSWTMYLIDCLGPLIVFAQRLDDARKAK